MFLDKLRDFFGSINDDGPSTQTNSKDDPKIAASALFFHVIEADGVVEDAEQTRLKDILSTEYNISSDEAVQLYDAGKTADKQSVDLYSFTSVLKTKLDEDQKVSLVEVLWHLAYADGKRHELEDHVIWRISDLLGVSSRERVLARQRVEEENARAT